MQETEIKTHQQTKMLFWYLFVGTRGSTTRIKIISFLQKIPVNKNQLAKKLGLDYKGIEHHMKILEEKNLVTKGDRTYGAKYFVSNLFEKEKALFDEIVNRHT